MNTHYIRNARKKQIVLENILNFYRVSFTKINEDSKRDDKVIYSSLIHILVIAGGTISFNDIENAIQDYHSLRVKRDTIEIEQIRYGGLNFQELINNDADVYVILEPKTAYQIDLQ